MRAHSFLLHCCVLSVLMVSGFAAVQSAGAADMKMEIGAAMKSEIDSARAAVIAKYPGIDTQVLEYSSSTFEFPVTATDPVVGKFADVCLRDNSKTISTNIWGGLLRCRMTYYAERSGEDSEWDVRYGGEAMFTPAAGGTIGWPLSATNRDVELVPTKAGAMAALQAFKPGKLDVSVGEAAQWYADLSGDRVFIWRILSREERVGITVTAAPSDTKAALQLITDALAGSRLELYRTGEHSCSMGLRRGFKI